MSTQKYSAAHEATWRVRGPIRGKQLPGNSAVKFVIFSLTRYTVFTYWHVYLIIFHNISLSTDSLLLLLFKQKPLFDQRLRSSENNFAAAFAEWEADVFIRWPFCVLFFADHLHNSFPVPLLDSFGSICTVHIQVLPRRLQSRNLVFGFSLNRCEEIRYSLPAIFVPRDTKSETNLFFTSCSLRTQVQFPTLWLFYVQVIELQTCICFEPSTFVSHSQENLVSGQKT